MADSILTAEDQQELFSEVYVSAMAASAGYTVAKQNLDRDGVDIQLCAGGGMRPKLDIQLKATFTLGEPVEGRYRYPLKVRNYDLLREDTLVQRILVLYSMPREVERWALIDDQQLTLRKCAYWVNLAGFPETTNSATVTIDVPVANLFTVACLKGMMEKVRQGTRI